MADAPTVADYAATYDNWDFHNIHVQQRVAGGEFINAESTLIASGPPSLSGAAGKAASTTDVYPIGLLETFGIQQSRQLQRIFEIGSSRSYFVPGRTIGNITVGRTFYYGPSLLKSLYAYYKGEMAGGGEVDTLIPGSEENAALFRTPGHGDFLIDLASDLFAQPTGMAVYFKNTKEDTYGGFYLEHVYCQGHQLTVSSGSVLIMEGASLQYDLLVPLDVKSSSVEDPTT
jgi:hypothetical protein